MPQFFALHQFRNGAVCRIDVDYCGVGPVAVRERGDDSVSRPFRVVEGVSGRGGDALD